MTTLFQPSTPIIKSPLNDAVSSVELLWIVGDDLEVVNDARVSYDKFHSAWDEPADRYLNEFLAWHNHWTPFAGNAIKFKFTMPLFIAREWYRHEEGFVRNEVSRRYIKTPPQMYVPGSLRAAGSATGNKQGSLGEHSDGQYWATKGYKQSLVALNLYDDMITAGIAPEQARIYLPQNMYTSFRETANLAAYARLCELRLNPAVMPETKAYAQAVFDILHEFFPVSLDTYAERWEVVREAINAAYERKRQARNSAGGIV